MKKSKSLLGINYIFKGFFLLSVLFFGYVFAGCNATTTGNWNDGTKWSGCSGGDGTPTAADDVTINSGVVMTVTTDASVNSVTVAENASAGSANGININSGITLAVTGDIAMTAPTALTSTIAVGAGNLSAVNITIPGSATSTRYATVSVSTGIITLTGSVTFSGTVAQARFIFTDTGRLNIGGNFGIGGTLTTTSHGTMNFNGSVAQTIGTYATYNNIEINNTSGGVSFITTATFLGTLTITTGTLTFNASAITITGATTVASGATVAFGGTGAKTFIGLVTIDNGGIWIENAAVAPAFRNGITNNGTFTASTGVHTFNTNAQALNGNAFSIPSITITGVVLTSNFDLTVNTALIGTGGLTMASNTTLDLGGTFTVTTPVVNGTGVVVNYRGTAAQTIKSTTYITLKINNTAATGASLTTGGATVTTLTIGDVASTARFQDAGFVLTLAGSSVLNLTQGTYDLGSATVGTSFPSFGTINIGSNTTIEYGAAVPQAIDTSLSYANLLITGVVAKSVTGNLTLTGNLTVTGGSGVSLDLGSYTHSIAGNIVVTTALGILYGGSGTITLQGNMSGGGQFQGQTGLLKLTGGSTQTLGVTTQVFNNLTLEKTTGTSASLTTATTINGALIITTGTFSIGGVAFTHNGTTSISDTLNITSTTGVKIFTGAVSVNIGGVWNNSGNSTVTFRGGITHNGTTFIAGTGVQTFDTNNQEINGLISIDIPSITVTTITLTNNIGGLTIATALSGTGGLTQGDGVILSLGGTSAITTLTASATGNTVNYTGAAQTVKPVTYHHLNLSGSAGKTLTNVTTVNGNLSTAGTMTATTGGNMTIAGTLTIGSGTTFTIGAFTIGVDGATSVSGTLAHTTDAGNSLKYYNSVTIESGGSWTNAANEAINFRGGLTHNGATFSSGSGVYTFDTNSQAIGGSSAITITNVTVTGVTLTNNSSAGFTVTTALAGTGELAQGNDSLLHLTGTSLITTLTALASGNVVNYNGTAAQTIKGTTYVTLKSNNTHASGATLGGDITVTTLTIGDTASALLFADGGFTITPSGSSVLNLTQGTYKLGSATVGTSFPLYGTLNISSGTTIEYGSAVAQNVSATPSYQNIKFTGVGTKTVQGSLSVSGSMTVNAASQTVDMSSYTGHSIVGNLVLTAGTLDANTSTITLQGNLTGAGTFNGNAGTLKLTGGGAQAIGTISSTVMTFNNLVLEKTAGTTGSINQTVTINGNVTDTTGILSFGGITFTVNGTTSISETITFTDTSGTKIFVGAVTINSGAIWTNSIGSAITFRGGLTHNGATFTSGSGIYTFNTNDQAIGGSSAITISAVNIVLVTLTNNSTVGFTANSTFGGTGGFTQATNAILNIGGTSLIATLTASATGNTINYTGAAQTVKPIAYYNLGLSGSGIKTLTSVSTVNGILTTSGTITATTATGFTVSGLVIGSGTTLTVAGFDFTGGYGGGTTTISGNLAFSSLTGAKAFLGPVTLETGGVWDSQVDEDYLFRGGLTHNGATFTAGSGVYTFDTSSQVIGGSSALSIPNITVTGVTLTNNSTDLTVGTALSGTGELAQGSSASLHIGGTSDITTLTASASGNTVSYDNATAGQIVRSITYHHITINKTGQTATLGGNITVNGNLNITNGTLDTSGSNYSIAVKGDWTNDGTFTAQNGTVTFSGTGTQTINNANTWYGLAITGSAARTVYFESSVAQTIAANGSLTLTGAASNLLTLAPLTPATAWQLQVNTTGVTQDVSYVNSSYSDAGPQATYATIIASSAPNTDGGNNTNWSFYGGLTVDIVDVDGNSVASPSITMSSAIFSLGYQNTDGSIGSSSQKIRVMNTTGNSQWVMSIAPENGASALWSTGALDYDFNDPTANAVDGADTDAYGGQLTIDPSGSTLTPEAGCTNTGITKGSLAAFSEGAQNVITILTSNSLGETSCYWDMIDINLSQTIPFEQTSGAYNIAMNLTVTAV